MDYSCAFTFINRGASLGHRLYTDDFVSRCRSGGQVTIGHGAVMGAGAVIPSGINIGADSVVAGGAVVTRDAPNNALVMSSPARVTKENILGYNGVGI